MSAFTDVHAAHHMLYDDFSQAFCCDCGERFQYAKKFARVQHAAHVEVELAKAGIAITQLPEPTEREDVYGDLVQDYLGWGRGMLYTAPEGMVERGKKYAGPYIIQYMAGSSGQHYTVESARRFAAALLAAAASIPTKETPNA